MPHVIWSEIISGPLRNASFTAERPRNQLQQAPQKPKNLAFDTVQCATSYASWSAILAARLVGAGAATPPPRRRMRVGLAPGDAGGCIPCGARCIRTAVRSWRRAACDEAHRAARASSFIVRFGDGCSEQVASSARDETEEEVAALYISSLFRRPVQTCGTRRVGGDVARVPQRCQHAPGGPCPRRPRGRCGSSTPGPEEEAAAAGGRSHRRHLHGNRCRRDVCVL